MKKFPSIKKALSVMLALILMIFAIIPTGAVSSKKYQIPKTKDELLSAYSRYLSLYDYMVEELKYRGYTDEEIKSIDRIDFQNISQDWTLTEKDIANILEMYPEWKDLDLSNWTYAQYELFSSTYEYNKFLPDEITKEKLISKGIKEKYLVQIVVSEFDSSYKAMLSSSNENLLRIQNMYIKNDQLWEQFDSWRNKVHDLYKVHLKEDKASVKILTTENLRSTPAVFPDDYVAISNYSIRPGTNYYLSGLGYESSSTRTSYSNAAMSIFWGTANTYTTYSFTNLWGEYSVSSGGPHEGLDFVIAAGQGSTVQRSMSVYPLGIDFSDYYPEVISVDTSEGRVSLYSQNAGITAIYRHMAVNGSVDVGDDWYVGSAIGTQSDEDASGIHVHLAVTSGQTAEETTAGDGILFSINPYNYAN